MSFEAKHIEGHGLGTRMDWLCIEHKGEGFGFGDEEAITCIDMTQHAPEVGKPNVVFSTYKNKNINETQVRFKINRGAYSSPEQIAMAKHVISNWDKIKRKDFIELDTPDNRNYKFAER